MKKILLLPKLLQSIGIYTTSNLINALIPFLLLPIMTRFMPPSDYGIVSMFLVLVGLVVPFTGLCVESSIMRKYINDEGIDLPDYITNCIFIIMLSSVVVGFVFWLLSDAISAVSSIPKEWLWAIVVVCASQSVIAINLILWQMQQKPIAYGYFRVLQTLMDMGISIFLVVFMSYGWKGKIEGQVLATTGFAILALVFMWRDRWLKRFRLKREYIKHSLSFGVPLIPHTLGSWVIAMTDRVFITNMYGLSETGVYFVAYQIGMIIGLLQNSFNQAWVPWLFNKLKQNNTFVKHKIVKFTYIYFIVIILLSFCITLISPILIKFFIGEDYHGAQIYIVWIAIGYAFNGMYKMVTNYVFYAEKTYLLAWVTFLVAIINIPLNYILIKLNGPVGASQSTAIAMFISFILTWVISSRVFKMPWLLVYCQH